jgi:ubiquinone/menaquinone biosynthesis C-methylase UbiE
MNTAEKRAEMPKGTNTVLDRRTLEKDNANLLQLLKKGQTVLDVGCGSGSITRGVVDHVGPEGYVVGIDVSADLIGHARHNFQGIKNLHFQVADINNYSYQNKFDVITSARVLQWVANPRQILEKMKALLKPGGCISILDYNHEKIEFTPEIPQIVQRFYSAFLMWRKDAGMDNAIADHLRNLFEDVGMQGIVVEDQSEISRSGTDTFIEEINIWKKVAETRGKQLVADGYLTEADRQSAIHEYQHWMDNEARQMKLYLKAVTGYNS